MTQYKIVYGIPEVNEFMTDLEDRFKEGKLNKPEKQLLKKIVLCMKKLSENPRENSLNTHEIEVLSGKYKQLLGVKIFESYVENCTPKAYRLFWYYHPTIDNCIMIAGIEPHPNNRNEYARLELSVGVPD